jgi:plasmid stability protein
MATLLIRRLDDDLKQELRVRASRNRRSMEEEVRVILREALQSTPDERPHFVDAIRKRIERIGGIDLELPPRTPMRDPPKFD